LRLDDRADRDGSDHVRDRVVGNLAALGHNGPMPRLVRALTLLALAATLSCCGTDSTASTPKPAPAKPAAREVRVVPAAESRVPRTVGVTGTLAADDQVVLSLKVAGRVSELPIDLGTRVRKGQVVARLDPTDFRLRVDQARAALYQARARLGLAPEGSDDR